jgi:hypothetical protein
MEPFVGTGADPGFSSKSAPTSPNYWPFRKHLRSRCSLTRSSYEGVAGQRCLQPKEMSSGSNTRTTQCSYITYQLRSILHIYLSDLKQVMQSQYINDRDKIPITHNTRCTWFTLSLGLRPQNCAIIY